LLEKAIQYLAQGGAIMKDFTKEVAEDIENMSAEEFDEKYPIEENMEIWDKRINEKYPIVEKD
jgi:hypothetical protein